MTNTTYVFKNCSTQFESFKPVVNGEQVLLTLTKQRPKTRRKLDKEMKIIQANIATMKAARENIRHFVCKKEWKLRKNKLSMHPASVAAREKLVDSIMENFYPSFYYWIDKHLATIYRNFDKCWKSLEHYLYLKEQYQKQVEQREEQRKLAFHREWLNDREAAMLGRLTLGSTDKQRYRLTDQRKGRKPIKRRIKFDAQRDEREQFLQGSDDEGGDI